MFAALLPRSAPFFELLLQQNQILCSLAEILADILENPKASADQLRRVGLLGEEANLVYRSVLKHLAQTFITPIDREDILYINRNQKKAFNALHNMVNRLQSFDFDHTRFSMLQLARILKEMAGLTTTMLEELSRRESSTDSQSLHSLRLECEMLLGVGLEELYQLESPTPEDILEVLKWRHAYNRMESAVSQVIELAGTVEEAILKNV